MMKTEKIIWGNPILDVQLFVPQEYCENCYRPITENGSWHATYGWSQQYRYLYIDLNKNGRYDVGEMFSVNSGTSLAVISNQTAGTVNVYGRYDTALFGLISTEYTNPPTGTPRYTTGNDFHPTSSFTIKIVNNTAYYLPAGANAS